MRVVLSGGGTAGHINPALALADVLKAEGHEVLYAGKPNGVEARLVGQTDIPFVGFEAAGFDRQRPWTLITSSLKILRSCGKAKVWMQEVKPDVCVAFGGHVCIPVGQAAHQLGIPLVVHEQNSLMGMANKHLSKYANKVALTYEVAGQVVADRSKCVVTGNPVRAGIFSATRQQGREMLGIAPDEMMLLVFGGSLGARHINQALVGLKDDLLAVPGLRIVHITGPKEYDTVCQDLALAEEQAARWTVMSYQDRMPETLAATDCVVSRSGATSLAEISALGIPALLVPFPYATGDHQTINARSYVAAGAAFLVADDQLETQDFRDKLFTLIDDAQVRADMKAAAAGFDTANAARSLYEVVASVARA